MGSRDRCGDVLTDENANCDVGCEQFFHQGFIDLDRRMSTRAPCRDGLSASVTGLLAFDVVRRRRRPGHVRHRRRRRQHGRDGRRRRGGDDGRGRNGGYRRDVRRRGNDRPGRRRDDGVGGDDRRCGRRWDDRRRGYGRCGGNDRRTRRDHRRRRARRHHRRRRARRDHRHGRHGRQRRRRGPRRHGRQRRQWRQWRQWRIVGQRRLGRHGTGSGGRAPVRPRGHQQRHAAALLLVRHRVRRAVLRHRPDGAPEQHRRVHLQGGRRRNAEGHVHDHQRLGRLCPRHRPVHRHAHRRALSSDRSRPGQQPAPPATVSERSWLLRVDCCRHRRLGPVV